MTQPGLLSVWNDIAAADEADFNAWYDEEHLAERVGLPGILTGRRYQRTDAQLSYAAIYDTRTLDALRSPEYLERLANPTPRTRAIMPRFLNMVRGASNVLADFGRADARGGCLAVLELGAAAAPHAVLQALAGHAPSLVGSGDAERIRFAVPEAAATNVPNPESKMRPGPDRSPTPFLLIEGEHEAGVRHAADALASALGAASHPRLYRLLKSISDPR